MQRILFILALWLAGCATPPNVSPAQNVINVTATSCKDLGAAIDATDQAVLTKVLTKSQAQAALKGLTAAQAGCVAALASIQAANPAASGVSQ